MLRLRLRSHHIVLSLAVFIAACDVLGAGDEATSQSRLNAEPTLYFITPNSAPQGSSDVTIQIFGADFVSTTVAQWDGSPLATTWVNSAELQAIIPASLLVTEGSHLVSAFSPAPGGGTSARSYFNVTAVIENPVPAISSIAPNSIPTSTVDTQITITGTNFIPTSSATIVQGDNAFALSTHYVSPTEIFATVPASYLTSATTLSIGVYNPPPIGGLTATTVPLTIVGGSVPAEVAPGAPSLLCARQISGAGRQFITDVATSNDGRIATIGIVSAPTQPTIVDFGGGPVTVGGAGQAINATYGFVAVYDESCGLLFQRIVSSDGALNGVAFDPSGALYVGAINRSTVDFGAGTVSSNGEGITIGKFDAVYNVVATYKFDTFGDERITQLKTDATGNLYFAGEFRAPISFGGDTFPNTMGNPIPYLVKLSPSGAHVFSKAFNVTGGNGFPVVRSLAVSDDGEATINIACANGSTVDFGGGPITTATTPPLAFGPVLARFTSSGAHSWSRSLVGFAQTGALANGDVVLFTGQYAETINGHIDLSFDYGSGSIADHNVLVRLNRTSGLATWSKGLVPTNHASGLSGNPVGTTPGGVFSAGVLTGTVDLGCGPITEAGSNDVYLARWTANGDCLYSVKLGDGGEQNIVVPNLLKTSGKSVVGGGFKGSLGYAATTLVNTTPTTEDGFVMVFSK